MVWRLTLIGLVGGVSSGLFGVGGGFIMVPLLIAWLGVDQRRASAISLVAIIPSAALAIAIYATGDQVNWFAAIPLAMGAMMGSPLGSLALSRFPLKAVKWIFILLLLAGIIRVLWELPTRTGSFELGFVSVLGLLILGLVMGVMAGLLGVGGGIIAVPVLMGFFGMGDLAARGTSLLALLPGAIVGSVSHAKRGFQGLRWGLIVALSALIGVAGGARLAFLVSPEVGTYLFVAVSAIAVALIFRRSVS